MASIEKEIMVAELRNSMSEVDSIIIAAYSGIGVNELTELRKSLRKSGGVLMVIKNSLAGIVMREDKWKTLFDYVDGPTALVMIEADFLAPVKILSEFAAKHEGFKIRGGLLGSMSVDKKDVSEIAKLPGRDVLINKVVQGFASPVVQFMRTVSSPMLSFASSVEQIRKRIGGESDAEKERRS